MDPNDPAAHTLRLKILEIELKAAQMRADAYRDLLLSFMGEGAVDATTSMRSASQPSQPRAVSYSSTPSSAPVPGPTTSRPVANSQPMDRRRTTIADEENLPNGLYKEDLD